MSNETSQPTQLEKNLSAPAHSRKLLVLIACFLGYMFDGMEMAMVPQIARPALNEMLKSQIDQLSKEDGESLLKTWHQVVESMFLFGAAFGGLIFGWLGDKIGRVRAMMVSILSFSLLTAALYFVKTPLQLCVVRFIASVGMGGEWALGLALVMEVWEGKSRPLLAGLIAAASNVGFVLVGLIAMIYPITPDNWRNLVLVGACPAILILFIRMFIPESPRWKHANQVKPTQPLKELITGKHFGVMLLCIAFTTVVLLGTWGAVQKIPAWVKGMIEADGGKPGSIPGLVQFISGIGGVTGCMLAPILANKLNRRWAYFILCVGSFVSCEFLFTYFKHYDGAPILIAIFIAGGITPAFYGWIALYLPELFPTRIRATAQGIGYNFGRILAGVGCITGGLISSNYAGMGQSISFIYVIGMIIIWFGPETKGKPLPE